MAVADQPPPGMEVLKLALTWPEKARASQVVDAITYVRATDLLKQIKLLRDEANKTFDPIISDAHRTHQTAIAQKRKVEAPLTDAERYLKNALVAYDTEQARKAREEQRRRDEEARRQAETEALERAAALEREGKGWGDEGLVQQAEQIVEEQIQAKAPPPTPLVRKEVPRVTGITHVTRWSGECVSLLELIKHCAEHPEHAHLLQVNQTALNNMARAMQVGLNRIPGVRAIETKDVSAGAR